MSGSTEMYHGKPNTSLIESKDIGTTHPDGNRQKRRQVESKKRKAKKKAVKLLRGGVDNLLRTKDGYVKLF